MLIPQKTGLLNTNFVRFTWISKTFSSNMVNRLKFCFASSFNAFMRFLTYLTSTSFLVFSIVFPKTEMFIGLKKSFSKSFFFIRTQPRVELGVAFYPRLLFEDYSSVDLFYLQTAFKIFFAVLMVNDIPLFVVEILIQLLYPRKSLCKS